VALADIIARIGSDASTSANAIVAEAEQQAAAIVAAARAEAERDSTQTVAAARAEAERDAGTIVVKARLVARDALVTTQREFIGAALDATAVALAALPDERYVPWLAARIAAVARGGETLSLGTLDRDRKAAVLEELGRIAPTLSLAATDTAAPFERGALLQGDRVRADLSLEAIVADRRDELELVVARVLFAEGA
jgi:vacuolar-type H+-ATPase subunit E/Vma4